MHIFLLQLVLTKPFNFACLPLQQAMNNTAVKTSHEYIQQGVPIVISIFIIVGLSFVPTSFVVYLVAERSTNAKHLQFCAGLFHNRLVYI